MSANSNKQFANALNTAFKRNSTGAIGLEQLACDPWTNFEWPT